MECCSGGIVLYSGARSIGVWKKQEILVCPSPKTTTRIQSIGRRSGQIGRSADRTSPDGLDDIGDGTTRNSGPYRIEHDPELRRSRTPDGLWRPTLQGLRHSSPIAGTLPASRGAGSLVATVADSTGAANHGKAQLARAICPGDDRRHLAILFEGDVEIPQGACFAGHEAERAARRPDVEPVARWRALGSAASPISGDRVAEGPGWPRGCHARCSPMHLTADRWRAASSLNPRLTAPIPPAPAALWVRRGGGQRSALPESRAASGRAPRDRRGR